MSPAPFQDRLLRVADILADCTLAEDFPMDSVRELPKDGSAFVQCFSPRRILGRWMGSLRRSKERKVEKEREREWAVRDFGDGPKCVRCSTNGLNGGNSSVSVLDCEGSGVKWKDCSFNVGVGYSLLYLIAASKTELSKMVELRSEMEEIVRNAKEELQSKDNSLNLSQTDIDLSISRSSTDAVDGPSDTSLYSVQLQRSCQDLSKFQRDEPNLSRTSDSSDQEKFIEGIDELEAEFEAEFEQLQIHLDGEDLQNHPKQQMIKVETTSARAFRMSCGEVMNPEEEVDEGESGVAPMELERRLHELLIERQVERIQELDTALECAKQEIREKDMEVSWWKETANLLSHHVS